MISIHFQGKLFIITVIQVYAPITNAEDEDEQFYEDPQDLLELSSSKKKKKCHFHQRRLEWVGSQETPGVTDKFGLGAQNEAGQRLTEFCQENALVTANIFFLTTQKATLYMDITRRSILKSD